MVGLLDYTEVRTIIASAVNYVNNVVTCCICSQQVLCRVRSCVLGDLWSFLYVCDSCYKEPYERSSYVTFDNVKAEWIIKKGLFVLQNSILITLAGYEDLFNLSTSVDKVCKKVKMTRPKAPWS